MELHSHHATRLKKPGYESASLSVDAEISTVVSVFVGGWGCGRNVSFLRQAVTSLEATAILGFQPLNVFGRREQTPVHQSKQRGGYIERG